MNKLIKKYEQQLIELQKDLDRHENELENETYNDYGECNESVGSTIGRIESINEFIEELTKIDNTIDRTLTE